MAEKWEGRGPARWILEHLWWVGRLGRRTGSGP